MSKIRILLWDIDGTVLNFAAAEKVAIRTGFERLNIGVCTDEMLSSYVDINKKYWQLLEKGKMTKQQILVERFKEFFSMYDIDSSNAEIFNEHYQIDLGDTICFNDNSYELICKLSADYKQYAVTNGTKIAQKKKLKISKLDAVFDNVFISDELGAEKPNKEFFDVAFDTISNEISDLNLDEIMIIGDSLTSDILGGNNAGILTCWYNPNKEVNVNNLRIDYEINDLNQITDILLKHK